VVLLPRGARGKPVSCPRFSAFAAVTEGRWMMDEAKRGWKMQNPLEGLSFLPI